MTRQGSDARTRDSRRTGMRKFSRDALAICFMAATAALAPSRAWAGNLDAFYLAGDAAMQGGAITSNSRGGGAIWYNPAGLAFLGGTRLDVSVNGYALRFGGETGFDPANPDTEVTRLSRLDLNVVPTALTLTRRFGSVGVGIGAFVPSQATSVLRTRLLTPGTPATSAVDFSYDAYSRYQNYHFGAAFGFQPFSDLSLGGAVFAKYQTLLENSNIAINLEAPSGDSVATLSHYTLDTVQIGLEFVVGTEWNIDENWDLGLAVRTPAFRLGELVQIVEMQQTATSRGDLETSTTFEEALDIGTSIINPARFHLGISRMWDDRTRVALEGNLLLPFEDERLGLELRPTWNVRAGIRRELGPLWAIGGGLFTDQSPNKNPDEFGDTQLNFYGATMALELDTVFGVHAKNGVPFERAKELIFGTSIAFSYALGVGSVMRAEVGAASDGGIAFETVPADVVAHEFTLHLGTNVME